VKVLADTSVWIRYLRRGDDQDSRDLHRLIEGRSVLACGPVLAEIVSGTPPEAREEVSSAFRALEWAEIDVAAWRVAGEAAYSLRRGGRTVALVDLVIAAAALRAEASVWTRDRDFERIRDVLPALQLYRPGSA
jgi:predicted nucleic acid-binding protein